MTEHHPGAPRPQDETSPLAAQPAQPAGATATAPPPPPPYAEPATAEQPAPRRRLARIPRAAWLSAAAVVVAVGIGLGGFFVGRATAPDDGPGRFPFENGQRPDFPGGGGGPGNGQMPGMPGQQGQQGAPSSDDDTTDGSADTTSWWVVPQAS